MRNEIFFFRFSFRVNPKMYKSSGNLINSDVFAILLPFFRSFVPFFPFQCSTRYESIDIDCVDDGAQTLSKFIGFQLNLIGFGSHKYALNVRIDWIRVVLMNGLCCRYFSRPFIHSGYTDSK